MIAERLRRVFHRIGLVVAVPCALGTIVAAIISFGLAVFPGQIGPIFGFHVSDFEITSPEGSSFRLTKTLEDERLGVLPARQQALLDEARRRGLVPPSPRSDTNEAARTSLAVAGILLLIGMLWLGTMRTIAWVLAGGFLD